MIKKEPGEFSQFVESGGGGGGGVFDVPSILTLPTTNEPSDHHHQP